MKKSQYFIAILLAGLLIAQWVVNEGKISPSSPSQSKTSSISDAQSQGLNNPELQMAFNEKKSNLWLVGSGEVINILSDDNKGSRHQRLLIKVNVSQIILIAHNIDLAKRVVNPQRGDMIQFYGEYEWNQKGGVVHWTHHDPAGKKVGGWIKHNNIMYQ